MAEKLDLDVAERIAKREKCPNQLALVARIRELEAELERASQPGSGEADMVLVPRIPTNAMVEAWNNSGADDFKIKEPNYSEFTDEEWEEWKRRNATRDWNAMVCAALDGREGGES